MKGWANRTDDREVSHANLFGETFLNQRHAGKPVPIAGVLLLNRLHEVSWKEKGSIGELPVFVHNLQILNTKITIRNLPSQVRTMRKLTMS